MVSRTLKGGIDAVAPQLASFSANAQKELARRLAAEIEQSALGVVDESTLNAIAAVVLEATQDGVTYNSIAKTAGQFGKVASDDYPQPLRCSLTREH